MCDVDFIEEALKDQIDAKYYLIISNGKRNEHPDAEAIEVIIQGSLQAPVLWFNYRSAHTLPWIPANRHDPGPYTVRYPQEGCEGIVFVLFGG